MAILVMLLSNVVQIQPIYLIEVLINGENLVIPGKSYGRDDQIGKGYDAFRSPEG